MKTTHKGFVIPILVLIVAILAVAGGFYFYTHTQNNKQTTSTQDLPKIVDVTSELNNSNVIKKDNIPDEAFVKVTSDSKGKVLAKGDINGDGYEDAIVQEVVCGASCSVNLAVVFSDENSNVKLFKPTKYANFEPSYRGSSAVKSEVTNVSISNGIISLTGKGLDCGKVCDEAHWNVVKTVNYKFNGQDIVQLI